MKLEIGCEIVCPDGNVRHYPYHNKGDALCDAEVYSERGCHTPGRPLTVLGKRFERCEGGKHEVRSVAFVEPTTTERSVA